jgi:L-ascorbate metabolism protein UlaG (beta-lactamase superfamily)
MRVVVPEPLVDLVREYVGAQSPVVGSRPGQFADVGDAAQVLATPAWHGVSVADGYTDGGWSETGSSRFVGYVVKLGDVTVYHAGDTVAHPALIDFLRPLDIDIALLPINGRDARREQQGIVGNLDAVEALDLASEIGARVLVPMHYEMVRGNEAPVSPLVMLAERRASGPRVWCLERGRSYELPGAA